MKKKLILIGMTIVMLLSITACVTNNPADDDTDNKNNIEEVNGEKDLGEENREGTSENKESIKYEINEEGVIKPEFAEKIIGDTADKVIRALSNKDFETISKYTHPVSGVRFTPYTYVSFNDDIVLSKEEIKNFLNSDEVYLWGSYDGIGTEISLTPKEYSDKFIYTEDFVNAEEVGYNKVLSSGNMLENQFEVYENPIVVEYYFSGFNPEYAGIDWRSLRLVFEEYEGDWKLVGMIHNQWTI